MHIMGSLENKKQSKFSYQLASFKYAWRGLRYFFDTEMKASIHLTAAILAIGLGVFLKISLMEWVMVALAIGIVFIAEIVNTAIELIVDLASPGQNRKAGAAKDLAASAVLMSSITALVVGLIVFLPKLIHLFL